MRYFIELAYNGTSFHGWQIQPNAVSVQSTLENALSIYFQTEIHVVGAGRTDTGVHARQMYAHFDTDKNIPDQKKFIIAINSMVGQNIFIKNVFPVCFDSHARFDAVRRTYKYFVSFNKNPFLNQLFWKSPSLLDVEAMNLAASHLLETEDFTSFAKLHSDNKTNICKVSEAFWKPIEEDHEALDFIGSLNNGIVFTITADRFLRNMVRAIVGTLVEVGKNKLNLEDFVNIIKSKNRSAAGTSMPPQALFLWEINYNFVTRKK